MKEEEKMETSAFRKSSFWQVISYSVLSWTIICFIGTWFIILNYGIILEGLVAVITTFIFAGVIWIVPVSGLVLLSLLLDPA